jgi:hypothetical protein
MSSLTGGLHRWIPAPAKGRGAISTPGQAMRAAARLMPPADGQRWLGEAESFLAEESDPELLRDAVRDYLATAPLVIAVSWARAVSRWARLAIRKVAR